jgi:predicted nucleotidyltransferase
MLKLMLRLMVLNMRVELTKILRTIEERECIKILFCIESGSRAWRMESVNSDYDVRFVFVRPVDDYLLLNSKSDVIVDSYNEHFDRVPQEGCFIDLEGFDIYKFLRMLSSSNPTVIEWLMSDLVYDGVIPSVLVDYAVDNFNPVSLYYHYKSMCRQNYLKYIQSRNLLTYKKYLYAMRGLINAKYVATFDRIPKINFVHTICELGDVIPSNISFRLFDIITRKKLGQERDIEEIIPDFDSYIEQYLNDDSDVPKRKVHRFDKVLNAYILGLLFPKIGGGFNG